MRVLYKYKLITLIIDLFIFALHFVIALARSAFYIIIMTIFVYITAAIVRVCLRTPWFSFSTTMKLVAYTTTLHFIFSIPSIMELPSFPWIAPYIFLMYHHIYSLSERQVAVPAPVAPVAPPAR